jgi:transcriptional regulator with XRE-family HTH domain
MLDAMRETGQDLTIGERVAWYRTRRGLSQAVVAGLVGRSVDWLSKVENGRHVLDRLSVITSLATALDVTVSDLLGEPLLLEWTRGTSTRAMTQLRDSLMSYTSLTGVLADEVETTPADLRAGVEATWAAYQGGRFGYVATTVPGLLAAARWLGHHGSSDADRLEGQRMLALGYHAAAAMLPKVGEKDLAWIAADRGLAIAESTQDPTVTASLMRSVAHSLLSTGRYSAAADVVTRCTDRLSAWARDDPTWWSLLGSLDLVGAVAASRADAPAEARTFLARARRASQRIGYDGNHAWTAFGPTNVDLHEVSVALELGDLQLALRLVPGVDARALPVERRVRHGLEVARVYALAGRPDEAVAATVDAERVAPEQVRYHFIARELVASWMRDPRTRGRRDVAGLARRLRLG